MKMVVATTGSNRSVLGECNNRPGTSFAPLWRLRFRAHNWVVRNRALEANPCEAAIATHAAPRQNRNMWTAEPRKWWHTSVTPNHETTQLMIGDHLGKQKYDGCKSFQMVCHGTIEMRKLQLPTMYGCQKTNLDGIDLYNETHRVLLWAQEVPVICKSGIGFTAPSVWQKSLFYFPRFFERVALKLSGLWNVIFPLTEQTKKWWLLVMVH